MRIHRSRSAALATLTGLVLGLTGCQGDGAAAKAPATSPSPSASTAASGTAPAPTPTPTQTPTPTPSRSDTPAAGASATPTGPDGKGSGGPGTDDSYAYTHPCAARDITVRLTAPAGFPATVRVITVTNNGSTTCGLAFHPAVGFSAKGEALGIQATPPDGLGGAPAHPVRPGATTYAAVDLNPSGGGGPVADEILILADPDHMPNAVIVRLPLSAPGTVARPKVGMYHFTDRDSFKSL
ncbi:DUF4232 domain-containing protein [Streptomyces sp. NPDC127110]|uniref:DUF4232 domain-containing protein n=1 Tax=Streptomyces sp. NPDC127110 TaxID=3345362 RepID=UPI00363FDA60